MNVSKVPANFSKNKQTLFLYKGYTISILSSRYTQIKKDDKYINTVDSVSSAKYVIDNNLL